MTLGALTGLTVSGGPAGNAGIAAGSGSLTLARVTVEDTLNLIGAATRGCIMTAGSPTL